MQTSTRKEKIEYLPSRATLTYATVTISMIRSRADLLVTKRTRVVVTFAIPPPNTIFLRSRGVAVTNSTSASAATATVILLILCVRSNAAFIIGRQSDISFVTLAFQTRISMVALTDSAFFSAVTQT